MRIIHRHSLDLEALQRSKYSLPSYEGSPKSWGALFIGTVLAWRPYGDQSIRYQVMKVLLSLVRAIHRHFLGLEAAGVFLIILHLVPGEH